MRMYQKESSAGVNVNSMESLNLNDLTNNPSGAFIDSSAMAFTPTTLAKFESTLNDLNDDLAATYSTAGALKYESSANQLWVNMNQSEGSDYDDDDSDDSNSNMGEGKRSRNGQQYTNMMNTGVQQEQRPRKLPGPRPSRTLEEMTPLEAERRRRRRERNKNAAAKCRQRRVDQTNELLAETEQLEHESTRLEREIEQLRRQKNQLEFVLEAHKPTCRAVLMPPSVTNGQQVKVEQSEQNLTSFNNNSAVRPSSLSISAPTTCRAGVVPTSSSIFSFDASASLMGLTPMYSMGDLGSPSSYLVVSPSTLLNAQ